MRRILIDTHILIWWLSEPQSLKKSDLDLISNPENLIYVSSASFFEISIKERLGKLEFNGDFNHVLQSNGFECLKIELVHLQAMRKLDFPNKDPFDMVIIAQSISENLELLTYDKLIRKDKNIKLI